MVESRKTVGRKLANDISRCLDSTCPARFECMRYLARNQIGERTSVIQTFMARNACNSLIQIDKGEWIAWRGGECPVDAQRKVEVLFADMDPGNATTGTGDEFVWVWSVKHLMEIVAFRVVD